MSHAAEVARHLLEIRAVKLQPNDPFTWASGIQSPIYCDNRVALSYPAVRSFLKKCLADEAASFEPFDVVAGVATAGIAHGALLADVLGKPFVYVRSSAKDHGRRNLIEGELPFEGARALVVEDLISTGGSCLKAAEALQEAGAQVAGVLAIFQYGFSKADQAFAEKNLTFRTLTDYDTLVREAIATGYVSPDDLATLRQWRENPEGWGALYA
ncbi:MAG TPA: orotate phosphoribosyltransferase [Saprospiraceae bacterium]|nr:orotate phosphoribosyltransferase [Saprospiraceae bacterium]HNM24864.1 orotate phosphoribosyltransferase [Saprospiraceae bacterium]